MNLRGSPGLYSLSGIAKALDFAFSEHARRKVAETTLPPPVGCKPFPGSNGQWRDDHNGNPHRKRSHPNDTDDQDRQPTWYQDVVETMCAMRGIGWNSGKGIIIPPETRNLSRGPFLRDTFFASLKGYIITDAIQMVFANLPSIGSF